VRHVGEAAEQRDAADEGRLDACGRTMVGTVIVNQGKVVRPSQLIASVRRLLEGASAMRLLAEPKTVRQA
jgi:hypothetical protein